jgi:hypothetical protein
VKIRERFRIEYREEVRKQVPTTTGTGFTTLFGGWATKEAIVEVILDTEELASVMGKKAARSTSGRCKNGLVVVRRVGMPKVVATTPPPKED